MHGALTHNLERMAAVRLAVEALHHDQILSLFEHPPHRVVVRQLHPPQPHAPHRTGGDPIALRRLGGRRARLRRRRARRAAHAVPQREHPQRALLLRSRRELDRIARCAEHKAEEVTIRREAVELERRLERDDLVQLLHALALEEEQLRRSAGRTRWLQHAVPLLPRPSEEHLERPPAARPYSEAAGHQISRAGGHDVLLLRHRLHHVVALPDCVQ
mmetsp:Transcript_52765/g.145873  ORF Transcript_52765/g.145873 Transcript_52765/m.145873 type:complete len:216 (-) Transcript_52765:207-854(-)